MDKKIYTHQNHYSPEYDYRSDMHKIDDHIKKYVHGKYHDGHMQHLGGAASLHDHVTDLHYGTACEIKKELARVLELLFQYEMTCHNIYCFFAQDALMHVERKIEDMRDAREKEHVRYYVDCVEEYMHWLKTKKTEKLAAQDRHDIHDRHDVHEDLRVGPQSTVTTGSINL